MARIHRIQTAEQYNLMREFTRIANETNDCSVVSIALVTGVGYNAALEALDEAGRIPKRGSTTPQMLTAIQALGFHFETIHPSRFIDQYPGVHKNLQSVTTHHPDRFNGAWNDGNNYLLFTRGHVGAVVQGVNMDWTRGKAKRVYQIVRVWK